MAAVLLYVCSAFVVWVCCWMPPVQSENVRCPSSCTCLGNNVDCSNFGLINIPRDIPVWATRLELQSNSITEIRPEDLKNLHNLQYLDLSRNNIHMINGSVFKDLTSLQTLKLDFNKLTQIPLFPLPLGITELTLSHNHVVTIPMPVMLQMPELLTMDLSNNYILSVINGSFPAGSKLTHLILNSNQISVIEQGSMGNLTLLETLKLNKNKLTELPQLVFNHLISLKTLDIMRNKIRSIKSLTFQGLNKLTVLKLQRNSITVLKDGAFWGLPSLISLQMDHNKVVNVTQAWLFGLKMLKTLSLSHNKINRIESGAWEPCKHLLKFNLFYLGAFWLDISDCSKRVLPYITVRDHQDLTHNKLTAITETTLAHLTTLETLLLDHNQISRVDEDAFRDQEDLNILELNSNQISWTMEDAAGAFRGLTSLTKLGLRANAIRSIAVHAFAGLPKLRQLYLEDNDIASIQENAFETLRDLRDLRFNSSKLFCDCHLAWLPPWLKQSGFQHSALGTCFHPPVLRGAGIFQIDVSDFKCNSAEFLKPVILESPKSANGYKGENLTLTCIAAITGDSQPRIHWKKDNMLLNDSLAVVTASSEGDVKRYTSHLHLTDMQDSMAGRYQCVVSNDFGSTFSQKAYINVYVYPVFLKVPKDVTVKAGKPAELKCAATGQPTPVISWQKDGGDNFPAARERRMQVYPNDDRFYIMNTRVADEGVYSCMARNEAGVVITNATVTVLVPPYIEQPMQSKKSSKKGETTVLQCMASGSPQPKLTWLKDDKELVMTPRHFFTADNQILVIVDTQWSDAGTYACRMSNSLGTAKGTTELQVVNSSGDGGESSGSFGLDDESTTTGIIIIAVVCCVVGTSLVWVIIIYQTRKRHEVYSATPTDETTLPGEIPSSGYMSSDKEGSYSQGATIVNGYHYQDYQMKESGYESSSGQFRANGYARPICPSDVDEDDNHPPTLTAGDRLLRQIKAANSGANMPYPASDEDTIGSRHSTSSGQHSGSTEPPSSSSGQLGHFQPHHQLYVVTSDGDEYRENPSPSLYLPALDKQSEFSGHRSNQQLVSPNGRSLFQTFHPTKPTNHDRLSNIAGGGVQNHPVGSRSEDSSRGCENRDRHGQDSDSCDNRDVESANSATVTARPACSVCMYKYSVMANSSPRNGHPDAHFEIHQANGSHPSVCLREMADGSGQTRLHPGNCSDNAGCNGKHCCCDHNPPHPPTSLSQSLTSSLSSPVHSHSDSKQRPEIHSRGCGNTVKKTVYPHGEPADSSPQFPAVNSDCHSCECSSAGARPLSPPRQTTSTPGTVTTQAAATASPCCCEVMDYRCCSGHCQPCHNDSGIDGGGTGQQSCSACLCQQHNSCHPARHLQHPHYLSRQGTDSKAIARSKSTSSVGHDPKYCAHSDPFLSPVHTGCWNLPAGEKPAASSRIHCKGRSSHTKPQTN